MLFNCEEDKERYIAELEKDRDLYSKEWREACNRLAAKNAQNKEMREALKILACFISHRATDATASQTLLDAMLIARKYTEEPQP